MIVYARRAHSTVESKWQKNKSIYSRVENDFFRTKNYINIERV